MTTPRTIDAVWYTGAKVPGYDWRTGQEYDLILSMKGCRWNRLNNGGPVLDSHNAYGVKSQMECPACVGRWRNRARPRFSSASATR